MPQQMIWFFVSIAFSLIAWGIVTARNIWPASGAGRRVCVADFVSEPQSEFGIASSTELQNEHVSNISFRRDAI